MGIQNLSSLLLFSICRSTELPFKIQDAINKIGTLRHLECSGAPSSIL